MGTGKEISPGCELSQMVQEGLIDPKQFHGIEGNPDIHKTNVNSLNKPYKTANLYHGEFTLVLDAALGHGNLKPGLVYLDTIQETKGAAILLATTMDIINQTT